MIKKILVLSWFLLLSSGPVLAQTSDPGADLELKRKVARIRAELKQDPKKRAAVERQKARQEKVVASNDQYLTLAWQLGGGLIGILVLAVFSIRGLKKLQTSSSFWNKKVKSGCVEVLDTCYLGKDQKVVVVKVNDRLMVLGATAQNIQLITELSEAPEKPSPTFEDKVEKEVQSQSELAKSLNEYLIRYKKQKPSLQPN